MLLVSHAIFKLLVEYLVDLGYAVQHFARCHIEGASFALALLQVLHLIGGHIDLLKVSPFHHLFFG